MKSSIQANLEKLAARLETLATADIDLLFYNEPNFPKSLKDDILRKSEISMTLGISHNESEYAGKEYVYLAQRALLHEYKAMLKISDSEYSKYTGEYKEHLAEIKREAEPILRGRSLGVEPPVPLLPVKEGISRKLLDEAKENYVECVHLYLEGIHSRLEIAVYDVDPKDLRTNWRLYIDRRRLPDIGTGEPGARPN